MYYHKFLITSLAEDKIYVAVALFDLKRTRGF